LRGFELGPCIWTREHWYAEETGLGGQGERIYLVRTTAFEPAPDSTPEELRGEGIVEQRWWTLSELEGSDAIFAPRRLPELVRDLVDHGPPPEPVDVGV
jgi:hypothetical protein